MADLKAGGHGEGGTPDDPLLFVFAHQDDELGYLGLLRHLGRSGRQVRVIWITDGAYSVPAEVRRRESSRVLEAAGVAPDGLEFWEYPDGRSIQFAVEIARRLASRMLELAPAAVYTVAYEGGHPDHDFAHFAAVTAARLLDSPPPVYEAPLYNKYRATHTAFNRFIPAETETLYTPLDRGDLLFKLRSLFIYGSQFWISGLPILLFGGRRILRGPGEPYRIAPSWNYRQPPHEGKLFYEGLIFRHIVGGRGFSDFRDAVSKVLAVAPSSCRHRGS
jgi:LmbE family N-acetylglucosaminyl deacetylase